MKTLPCSRLHTKGGLGLVFLGVLTLSASRGQTTGQIAASTRLPAYTVTDVGLLPGFGQMIGSAINIEGDIVGTAYTGLDMNGNGLGGHGFLYQRGKLTDLGPGTATAINDRGEVLGYRLDSSGNSTPFSYQNGTFTTLPANAYALNDLGQILIQVTGAVEIREPNGTILSHPITNGSLFVAWAINDLGQVIGRNFVNAPPSKRNAFGDFYNQVLLVQPNGGFRIIARNGVSEYCFPQAMNNLGQAVGHNVNIYYNTVYQDFLYDEGDATLYNPDGKSVNLGNLLTEFDNGAPPGSIATGINDFGVIVGYCYTADNQVSRGFVYRSGTMYDLNSSVNSGENGLTIKSALGINDLGQIVATATNAAGNEHAVILTATGSRHARSSSSEAWEQGSE
jgi:probable HAF family extracellular repeat protein